MSFRVSALLQAVSAGDENAVSAILATGADVNAKNDGGQTPLILAIVSGQPHLIRPLLSAGADPLLQDNTGLNAIEWAARKGRGDLADLLSGNTKNGQNGSYESRNGNTPKKPAPTAEELPRSKALNSDEKSRKYLAGLRQRLEEKASRPQPPVPRTTDLGTQPAPAPPARTERHQEAQQAVWSSPPISNEPMISHREDFLPDEPHEKVIRKRCPECNRIYSGELIAYCSYHVVPLVDANEPITVQKTHNPSTLFWLLVAVTAVAAALAGLFITNLIINNNNSGTPTSASAPVNTTRKGIPVLGRELLGKAVSLPEAEPPAVAVTQPTSVTVKIQIDKSGKVLSASSTSSERALSDVAIVAAKKATFSVEKLRARGAEGTITYTFNP